MSTHKTKNKLLPRSTTPKSNVKPSTPRTSTLKSSTPKTDPKQASSKVVKNLNTRVNPAFNTTVVDPTHSQKFMQHKLDMVYNKYLQTLALKSWLTKKHNEADISIDEQLVYYEEMHESSLEEEQTKMDLLKEMNIVFTTEIKLKCLVSSLQKITEFIKEKHRMELIKKLNSNLHYFCDNLLFENIKFVSTEENYNMLGGTLEDISSTLTGIKSGNNEEFLLLSEYIFKVIEMLKNVQKNKKVVKNYQNDLNNLTLRAASMELSKTGTTLKK